MIFYIIVTKMLIKERSSIILRIFISLSKVINLLCITFKCKFSQKTFHELLATMKTM